MAASCECDTVCYCCTYLWRQTYLSVFFISFLVFREITIADLKVMMSYFPSHNELHIILEDLSKGQTLWREEECLYLCLAGDTKQCLYCWSIYDRRRLVYLMKRRSLTCKPWTRYRLALSSVLHVQELLTLHFADIRCKMCSLRSNAIL